MWGVSLKCWLTSFTTENWPCIIKYVCIFLLYIFQIFQEYNMAIVEVLLIVFASNYSSLRFGAFLLHQQKMTILCYILLNLWSCHKSAWTYSTSIILLKYVLQYVNLIYCASIFHICTQHVRICNIKIELLHTDLTTYINGNVCT